MRKIVFMMSVSVDGYFAAEDGSLDWQVVDAELHGHFNEWLGAAGAFLDGRVTYELMADYWPAADANPAATPTMVEFARIWRDMPKYVFSTTMETAGWNTTIRREIDEQEIRSLQDQPGGDLVLGGANLARGFQELDLIDEYRLYVQPMLLGRGQRLFEWGNQQRPLRLAEVRAFSGGVTLLRYDRGTSARTRTTAASYRS
jgi:dihydrofolate reductase